MSKNCTIIMVGSDMDQEQLKTVCDAYTEEQDISNVMISAKTANVYEYIGSDKDLGVDNVIKIISTKAMPIKTKFAMDNFMKNKFNAFEFTLYNTFKIIRSKEPKVSIEDIIEGYKSDDNMITAVVLEDFRWITETIKDIKKHSPNYVK